MEIRTDLALEARELRRGGELPGVRSHTYEKAGFRVTDVTVTDERGARALGKPVGQYVTVELEKLLRREDDAFRDGAEAVGDIVRAMIAPVGAESVLVVGLGNLLMTPDALGPLVLRSTMVTRHLREKYPRQFGGFKSVSALEPGVLGTTGMESATVIQAVAEKTKPQLIVVIDALASRRIARVCRTVQLSDTGITPGSGVGNARAAISRETLGIPVVALGVPTVVDAATLAADAAEAAGAGSLDRDALRRSCGGMIVTPRDIDANVRNIAKLIGYGLNLALHDGLTVADIDMFLE